MELRTARGQLADQGGESAVIGIAARLTAQHGNSIARDLLPAVAPEPLGRSGIQKVEAGGIDRLVRRTLRRVVHRCVQGPAQRVRPEYIQPAVADERGGVLQRVEDPPHHGAQGGRPGPGGPGSGRREHRAGSTFPVPRSRHWVRQRWSTVRAGDTGWAGGATLGAGFLLTVGPVGAQRRADQPVIPLTLFASRERTGAYLARLLFIGAGQGLALDR